MRKRNDRTRFGFSNEKFLQLMADSNGISPIGILGRETPLDLSSLEAARGSLLIRELFSKYDDGTPSPEKEKTTWIRFHAAEEACKMSNFWIPKTFKYCPFWELVRIRIKDTLGTFSWDRCSKHFAFGPGATTRLTRKHAAAAFKYSGIPESTVGNSVLASCAIRMNPLWTQGVRSHGEDPNNLVKIVKGNRVIVVPKNFKTDRTIAKEPCMNIYIQKGIGRLIRNRLKLVGVDLNDQTPNQRGALLGSLTGELATIDLSMASDTLAFDLVSYLLPNDWYWALEQARSPIGVLPSGEQLVYQKFSSMGNGYTFELETLIFWAIAQQVCHASVHEKDSRVLVYGDDIVVPSDKSETVCYRLWQAGFTPNLSKTFHTGPYRESCGKHYFQGHDITPFYVRRPVQTLDRLFLVHNNVYRWSERTAVDLTSVLTTLKELAPASWRKPRLPDGFGDGAFIGAIDELCLDSHPWGWDCWIVKTLSQMQRELSDDLPDGQLIASLLAMGPNVLDRAGRRLVRYESNGQEAIGSFEEHISGLPVREGKYGLITQIIQRRTLE